MSRICPVGLSDRRDAMNSSELVSLAGWLGYSEYNSSCFHRCNGLIRRTSLLTPLIYPCHSAGGTVRAFILFNFNGTTMPSADSRYAIGSPCGSLTRGLCILSNPLICVPNLSVGLARAMTRYFPDARGFVLPVSPIIPVAFQIQPLSRRNGPPGVNSATFSARSSDIRGLIM